MGEMVLHCWEDGPRGDWGELPGSTCMLEDGHVGPHQFTPNNEIGVAFVGGIEALKDAGEKGAVTDG